MTIARLARCFRLVFAGVVMALVTPAPARADDGTAGQTYIDVVGAQFKPLPIAIEPSQGDATAATEFTNTLREDLTICGFFDVLNPKSFLADIAREPTIVTKIDFTKWRAVGASYLAKATLRKSGSNVTVEAWLFDVFGPSELIHTSFPGQADDVPTLAHRWANMIVRQVSGQDGYFLTRVAYTRATGRQEKQLWVADLDGRHAMNLTPGSGLNLLPAWSPDGRKVVFTSFRDGSPMLYLADVVTRAVTALPKRGNLQTGAAFSPDGRRIAFTMSDRGNANIYVMNADGSDLRALTDTRETNSSPCWSPDGKRIAFVSTRSGDPQIFVMNADGTGVDRLTFQGRYNQTPDWSPRGDEIAFTARDERNVFDLFTVNVEKKTIHRLTQDSGQNEEPSYAPNGNSILFTSTRTGRKQIWVMNRDGSNQHALAIPGEANTPAWGPMP
jgi:TolB protein